MVSNTYDGKIIIKRVKYRNQKRSTQVCHTAASLGLFVIRLFSNYKSDELLGGGSAGEKFAEWRRNVINRGR